MAQGVTRVLPLRPNGYPTIASCTLEYLRAATSNRKTRRPWRTSKNRPPKPPTGVGFTIKDRSVVLVSDLPSIEEVALMNEKLRLQRQIIAAKRGDHPVPGIWEAPSRNRDWTPDTEAKVAEALRKAGMSHLF